MNITLSCRRMAILILLLVGVVGCDLFSPPATKPIGIGTSAGFQNGASLPTMTEPTEGLKIETVGERKRLQFPARVCLRELGQIGLECLVCGAGKKEHESILATNTDALDIYEGLKKLGAVPGAPPEYVRLETAAGKPAKVALRYQQGDQVTKLPMTWTVPPDMPFRFYAEYGPTENPQPVPITGEAPADTPIRAWVEYTRDGNFVTLRSVQFRAPAGPALKIGLEINQDDKVTTLPALYNPAHGTSIKVSLRYEQAGKQVTVPAGKWVRNGQTNKDLEHDFVFAGSAFFPNPLDPEGGSRFAASGEGAYLCVCDVPTALLSLPVWSPKGEHARFFEPATERIPPLGTKVTVILEPVPGGK
jgi:hypothetical protein